MTNYEKLLGRKFTPQSELIAPKEEPNEKPKPVKRPPVPKKKTVAKKDEE